MHHSPAYNRRRPGQSQSAPRGIPNRARWRVYPQAAAVGWASPTSTKRTLWTSADPNPPRLAAFGTQTPPGGTWDRIGMAAQNSQPGLANAGKDTAPSAYAA